MKLSKYAKYYALATQGIITMVVLLFAGYILGKKINADSFWPGLLAAVGALCGLVSFIMMLLKLLKEEEKNRKDGINSKN